jgi:hypothetical protein
LAFKDKHLSALKKTGTISSPGLFYKEEAHTKKGKLNNVLHAKDVF